MPAIHLEETVLKALQRVEDPDLKKDLVTLQMIRDLVVEKNRVSFRLVLTTPACPLKEFLRQRCESEIKAELGEDIIVDITMDAEVIGRSSDVPVLPSVKNVICVASGKGGVGKSTFSVNLAYALSSLGAQVGIIDADIHGPSIPHMLGIQNQKPQVRDIKGKHYMIPIEKDGVKVLSIGFLVDERQAVVWRGPMVTSALKQFVTDCLWGKLDYLIIDMPPGTGDVHITMAQTVPITGVVIISTPQQIAVADARKAIAMYRLQNLSIPIIGIVENMSWFSPEDMPEKKYYLFGKGGAQNLASEYEIPFLGHIPVNEKIMQGAEDGIPAVFSANMDIKDSYKEIATKVAQQISIQNSLKKAVEQD